MNLQEARKVIPELSGLSDQSALNVIHQAYYPNMSIEDLSSRLGVPAPEASVPDRTFGGVVKDVGISALRGTIAIPEAAVGMADIVSGGRAGKALEDVGFKPKEAKQILSDYYSEKQKQAFQNVQQADGVVGTMQAALQNPSVIAHSIIESIPSMLAGGAVGRGVLAAAGAKATPVLGSVAAGIGEGVVSAGSTAEQIRQQTPDGLLTGEQAALSGATGVATTAFGILGSRVAQRLGVADVNAMLVGAAQSPVARKGVVIGMLEGALSEGVLEELPQSISEQVLQNKALGKPLDDGVDQAAVLGLLSGAAMGSGANALSAMQKQPSKTLGDHASDHIKAVQGVEESGPMTRAANIATGIKAEQAKQEVDGVVNGTHPSMQDSQSEQDQPLPEIGNQATGQEIAQAEQLTTAPKQSMTGTSMADMLQGRGDPLQAAMQKPVVNESLTTDTPDQLPAATSMIPKVVDPETGEIATPITTLKPLDFTGRTDEELSQAHKNAQDTTIRKALATELQARRAAAKPAKPVAEPAPVTSPVAESQTDSVSDKPTALPKELAGAKEKYNYGKKAFTPTFESDVDRAAFIASQKTPSKRDADYLKFAMDATGMTEAEVRAHGQKVRESIKAQAKDAEAGPLTVQKVEYAKAAPAAITPKTVQPTDAAPVQAPAVTAEAAAPSAQANDPEDYKGHKIYMPSMGDKFMVRDVKKDGKNFGEFVAGPFKTKEEARTVVDGRKTAPVTRPATSVATKEGVESSQPPQAAPTKLKTASKEDLDHLFGLDMKRPKAIERVNKGTAYFGMKSTAEEWIKANGIKDTHEVLETKLGRFDVKAKEQAQAATPAPSEAESQWTRSTTNDRIAIAQAGGIQLKAAENVAKKGWGETDPVVQEKIARGIAKRGQESESTPDSKNANALKDLLKQEIKKQKSKVQRLERENEQVKQDPASTLGKKVAAKTALRDAESTLNKMRGRIFEAEDSIDQVMSGEDPQAFGWHEDKFPITAKALAEASKNSGKVDTTAKPVDSAPKNEQVARRIQPGEEGYTMAMAREDLQALNDRNGGMVEDARVNAQIKQQEKLIKDMQSAQESATKPADPDAEAKAKAQKDLDDALGELGMILTKGTRMNMLPDQERALLPVLTQVMDASFRLGYYKFKESSRFVLDTVRAKFGKDVADMITLDHLQGAYIGMGGKYQDKGASTKKEVIAIESLDELADTENETVAAPAKSNSMSLAKSLYQTISNGGMPKDNPALKKLVEAFDGQPADQARMKQAQEELETAIAMTARDVVARNEGDRSTFDVLLRLYESQPNLNIRTSTSIVNQAYSTPAPLAFLSSRLAGITKNTIAHEPTGGTGMLMVAADPKKAIVNELNDLRIEALKAQGFAPTQKDAATQQLVPEGVKTQAVNTNPPFGSIKDADGKPVKVKVDGFNIGQIDHLIAARALETLEDSGRGTLILGANKVAGGLSTDDRIFFNWLYSHYNVVGHFEVDGGLYTRQGASWPVRVITINGRQKSNRISPVAGVINRVDNWNSVYEQFEQSLAASQKPISAATDSAGKPIPEPVRSPAKVGGEQPTRSTGGDANVDGASPRVVPDRAEPSSEPVGDIGDEQRINAQSYAPQPQQGQGNDGATRSEKPAGNAALEGAEGNAFQSPYTPRSSRKDEGVLIPANMAQPTQDALSRLEDEVGDIDEYARKELGYDSVGELHNALMGLQVDSVATSIYQIKQGKAVVIADQTGIGKGRQAASIIRWASKQGMTPVFVSVKPSLFTDMYGDLADIGTNDVTPFILNGSEWIAGEGGTKLFANKPSTHKRTIESITSSGQLPEGSNALFMTYSQINVDNMQRRALMALAPNAVFVLDESHNAAGASSTGEFVIGALEAAKGVVYLSATYAKRPDNMPLYFKTDIGEAAADTEGLAVAMASGGLPLQTVVSNNLVKAGQMFRRERSYDGVEIKTIADTANRELHERMSNEATKALRAIVSADRMFHEVYVKQLAKQLAEDGATVQDTAGNQIEKGVQHTEFSSVVHNFVKQMLLGLKAQSAADEAISSIKRGEKPIIAVESTMGSFLNEYAATNGIGQGESLGEFDYRTILSRALARSRTLIEVGATGDKVKRSVPLSELDSQTVRVYEDAQEVIDGLTLNIPVSPIDWMRAEIIRAGFTVAEITGRNLSVDYSNPKKPILSAIDETEQKDKVNTTRQFNGGSLDSLILNVAGSTGISLHASEKFADQRQRHMIVAQAAGDINIFMQMLGRVHRTGQVRLPKYAILNVDLPTEKRPTAVLSIKMKSLNANTSSNTESATSVKSADILNKYGDQIVNQYLVDNYALAKALDMDKDIGTEPTEDVARKATGRLALQPIATQLAFYEEVESQYTALIDYLDKTNQNDLEPRTFDFDAKEMRQDVLYAGPDKNTPFGEDSIYGEYSIKAQGTPMKPEEIKATIAENLDGLTPMTHVQKILEDLDSKFTGFHAGLEDAGKDAASVARSIGREFLRSHRIGATFRVEINSEPFNAVVMNVRNTHKEAGNPYSLSKIQVTIAINGALRSLSVPATQFNKIEVSSLAAALPIEGLFKEQPPNQRETAKIVTGNLLAAYGELKGVRGTIITFTKQDGTSEQGILLPKLFDFSKNTMGDYRLVDGAAALKFLQQSNSPDIGRFGIASRDGVLRVLPAGQGIRVQVPKSKLKGAKYFLDKGLIEAGGDFVTQGNFMTSVVSSPADARKMLELLMKKQALYALPSMADEAKKLTGDDKPVFSRGTGRGIDVATAQSLVDEIRSKWENSPEVIVVESMADPKVPQAARDDDAAARKSQQSIGSPEGFFLGGKVYIVANALHSQGAVMRVLFHESLGHFGLRGTFGEKLDPILKQLATVRRGDVSAKAKQYGLDMNIEADRLTAAEEVLAEMAQSKPEIGFVQRAIAVIRGVLRKLGFDMKMTDADIIGQYIMPARAFVERGGRGAQKGKASFSRVIDNHQMLGFDNASGNFNPDLDKYWIKQGKKEINGDSLSDADYNTALADYANQWRINDLLEQSGWRRRGSSDVSSSTYYEKTIELEQPNDDGEDLITYEVRVSDHDDRHPSIDAKKRFQIGFRQNSNAIFDLEITPDTSTADALSNLNDLFSEFPELNDQPVPVSDGAKFSRAIGATDLANKVRDEFHKTFSHSGKLSWWHKTIGSQYNLAEREPAFKKVFDAAQNFINDVSYYGTEAANMAPKMLPKLETLKDLTKTAISAADNKAVAAPVFEGTLSWTRDADGNPVMIDDLAKSYESLTFEKKARMLMRKNAISEAQLKNWKASPLDIYESAVQKKFEETFLKAGLVWTDDELSAMFKLTPEQIDLYKEFRASTDTSLDNMAKAQMLREGGKDVEGMRDAVMAAPDVDTAAMMVREFLLDMASGDPDRADMLTASANSALDSAAKVNELKKQGYAPLSRFGRFTVDVVVDGERQYFGLYETERDSNNAAAKMRMEFGPESVEQGTMSQKEFELFQGITPESLEIFGSMMGLDATGNEAQDKAFQSYIKLTKNNRSAMKRLIHRKGVAGYSEDVGRVLAAFVYANARQTSAALHIGEMDEAINEIPKGQGELKDHALELAKYVKEPREEAAGLRGLMFAQYLGGSVASAMVNFTQPLTVSIPYLSQFGGLSKAGKAWAKAVSDMTKGVKLEAGLERALKSAEESGVVSPQEVHQLMAQARGAAVLKSGDGTKRGDAIAAASNGWTRSTLAWGKLFGYAEQVNRRSTFIAAYRMAVENKNVNPAAFAEKAVNETQFINNKANKMKYGRGAIGATLMTFKSYSLNWLELMHRLSTQDGKEGKLAAAYMLGALFLMAGASGLPFAGDAEDLVDAIAQKSGYNFSSKKEKQEFLEGLFGKAGADFVDRGITGLNGVPIDLSGRMGMANLIPATGLLLEKRDHSRDMQELAGPIGDMAKRTFEAIGNLASGDVGGAIDSAAPRAMSNVFKGVDMANHGMYRDTKGAKVIDTTTGEAVAKMIGFQPSSVAQVQDSNAINQRAKDFYALRTQDVRAKWAQGMFEGDQDKVTEARKMMSDWNTQNPDQKMTANMPAIIKKVREMRKDKAQRIADTAPKSMRAKMKRDIREAAAN